MWEEWADLTGWLGDWLVGWLACWLAGRYKLILVHATSRRSGRVPSCNYAIFDPLKNRPGSQPTDLSILLILQIINNQPPVLPSPVIKRGPSLAPDHSRSSHQSYCSLPNCSSALARLVVALGFETELLVQLGDLVVDGCRGRVDGGAVGEEVVEGDDGLGGGQWARVDDLKLQWWWWGTGSRRHFVCFVVVGGYE